MALSAWEDTVWEVVGHDGGRYLMRTQGPKTAGTPDGWYGRIHDIGTSKQFVPKHLGMTPHQWLQIWGKFGEFEYANNQDYIEAGGDWAALEEPFDPENDLRAPRYR